MFLKKKLSLFNRELLAPKSFFIKIVIILGSAFFLSFVQADAIPEKWLDIEKSIWKYVVEEGNGTGFFISEKHFVTNFHVLTAQSIDDLDIQNISLIQEGSSEVLKIKKVLHISSVYDLALLEIKGEVSHYLKLGELRGKGNLLYVFGYPKGVFQRMQKKKEYDIFSFSKDIYYFPINHSDPSGASGSPVLNDQGKVVGVISYGVENTVGAIYPDFLQKLIQQELSSNCLDFIDLISCMKEEIENLKETAEQGYAPAQYRLATKYNQEIGIEKNLKKTFYWFKKSAEQGYAPAQCMLAGMYYLGEGTEQDSKKVFYWFKKSAEQGYFLAQHMLANVYYLGEGIAQDYEKALHWFKKSAEQGFALAQYSLATMYDSGEGTEQDSKKAFHWFKKSAEQGYAPAQYMLTGMYYLGDGTEQDSKKALYWFTKSAEQGFTLAQYRLAAMYYHGEGIEQDYEETFNWSKKAAEQGYVLAQYNLATMYYYGEGIEQDYEKALYWFTKAAEQGYLPAQRALENLFLDIHDALS